MSASSALWRQYGFHLLARDARGRLRVSDDYLRSWLARPELAPVEESCAAERRLHAAALADPRLPITPVTLLRLRDRDARENWEVFVRFRDHLLAVETIEDAYLGLFLGDPVPLPAMFADHLCALVLANMLADSTDAFRLRAAELFFRPQKVAIRDGNLLLGDEEVVEALANTGGFGDLGALVRQAAGSLRTAELEVLDDHNADAYLARIDRHEFVLDLTFGRSGLDALCRLLESWLAHFFDIAVEIQPVARVRDERWRWHIGLDAEATAILNALYRGEEVEEERLARLLALFRLEFRDPNLVIPDMRGRPVYLALAADTTGRLRMKPQNLLVNLPLLEAS